MPRSYKKWRYWTELNRLTNLTFKKPPPFSGTIIQGFDFANQPLAVRMLEGPTGRPESRLFYNVVPTGVREHVMVCNVCAHAADVQSKILRTQNGKDWNCIRRRPGEDSHNFDYVQHLELAFGGMKAEMEYQISRTAFWQYRPKQLRWAIEWAIKQKAKEMIDQHFEPFDTDGWNVGENDLIHCMLCPRTLLVLECGANGVTQVKWVDMIDEMRKFHVERLREIRYGEHEERFQDYMLVEYPG